MDACNLDWQAIATFVTGFLAVGGAVYVGRKQLGITAQQTAIAEKQTEILARQVRVAELTLRHELFDRRYEVFRTVQDFLGEIIRDGTAPPVAKTVPIYQAIAKSRLLFRPSVYIELMNVLKAIDEYRMVQYELRLADERGLASEELTEVEQRARNGILNYAGEKLLTIFGEELKLSQD